MGSKTVRVERGGLQPVALEPTSWRDLAACRGEGQATFFGPGSERARGRCVGCPVDEVCFWYAMASEEETGHRSGVWGRTTAAQRVRIARLIGPGYARRRLELVAADRSVTKGSVA